MTSITTTTLPKPFFTREHYKPRRQTTPDEILKEEGVIDWSDKVILITGATSGIGLETAKAFAKVGAHIIAPARDKAKAQNLVKIVESLVTNNNQKPKISILNLNLNSLQSVRDCAAEFLKLNLPLNILICNAGVMAIPEATKTEDGFDEQFGTNHLAHFLLFELLKDKLLASSTPSFNSRVVTISSSGHQFSDINWDDINFENGYDQWKAYGQSKTANVLMAREIEKRYGNRGLHANALHPGTIWTDLGRNLPKDQLDALFVQFSHTMKQPDIGAATTVWAACATELEGKGGYYLEDCSYSFCWEGPPTEHLGHVDHVYNEESARRLYDISLELVGLPKKS